MVRPNRKLTSLKEANHIPSQQKLATNHHKKAIKSNYAHTSNYVNRHELERRENETNLI